MWRRGPEYRSALATSRARPTTSRYRHPRWRDIRKVTIARYQLSSSLRHLNNCPFHIESHKHDMIIYLLRRGPAASHYLHPARSAAYLSTPPPSYHNAAWRQSREMYTKSIHRRHFVLIISLDVNFIGNGSMDFLKTLNVSGNVKHLVLHKNIEESVVALFVL